jgi:hypothetical protein
MSFVTGSTYGIAAAAALGPAVSVGAGTTAFMGAYGYAFFNGLAAFFRAHGYAECLNPPSATEPPRLSPAQTADVDDFMQEDCGAGMVSFYGPADYCVDGPDDSDFSEGEVVVDANYTCATLNANGECIPQGDCI